MRFKGEAVLKVCTCTYEGAQPRYLLLTVFPLSLCGCLPHPEELRCTPALLNASAQNKPDTHHWALFRKSTNYWSPTDTTGLNLSCFKSPAGCMGVGDWKQSSNQSQTLQLEYLHTNEAITSFPPNSPCTGQGELLLLCT